MKPIRVAIQASDPIKRAGVTAQLRTSPNVHILTDAEQANADVLVLAEDNVARLQLATLRRTRAESARQPHPRCVLVADRFDESHTLFAVHCGVMSILPSRYASAALLTAAVLDAAKGSSRLPRRLQGALLRQLDALRRQVLEPNGVTLSGLRARELDTIRLLAEGLRTSEIAAKLSCSEGTVKTILYDVMKRLRLANRTHAVAYAIRTGALA